MGLQMLSNSRILLYCWGASFNITLSKLVNSPFKTIVILLTNKFKRESPGSLHLDAKIEICLKIDYGILTASSSVPNDALCGPLEEASVVVGRIDRYKLYLEKSLVPLLIAKY